MQVLVIVKLQQNELTVVLNIHTGDSYNNKVCLKLIFIALLK